MLSTNTVSTVLPDSIAIKTQVCNHKYYIANVYSMSINCNGSSTICELMYQNKDFYMGNVTKETIKEVWNSEKALTLYSPKKDSLSNTTDNPCFSCEVFDECKTTNKKEFVM